MYGRGAWIKAKRCTPVQGGRGFGDRSSACRMGPGTVLGGNPSRPCRYQFTWQPPLHPPPRFSGRHFRSCNAEKPIVNFHAVFSTWTHRVRATAQPHAPRALLPLVPRAVLDHARESPGFKGRAKHKGKSAAAQVPTYGKTPLAASSKPLDPTQPLDHTQPTSVKAQTSRVRASSHQHSELARNAATRL